MSSQQDHFRFEDLPELNIPSDLDGSSHAESDSDTELSGSGPPTPSTPITPVTHLASFVTEFSFSETESVTTGPSTSARRGKKFHPGRFAKGHKRRALFITPTKSKRASISKSELLKETKCPQATSTSNVRLNEGGRIEQKQLLLPQGSQIMNLEILSLVFQMLRCTDATCPGSLRLHQFPYHDGLQGKFVLHCSRCHTVVEKFSSSLYLNEQPSEAINSKVIVGYRRSQINIRSMFAIHATSLSWQDFRLACALFDLQILGRNMRQSALDQFQQTTSKVTEESMRIASRDVAP